MPSRIQRKTRLNKILYWKILGGRGMEALWLAYSVFIKSKGIDALLSPLDISWHHGKHIGKTSTLNW